MTKNVKNDDRLTPKQKLAIQHLANGKTIIETARLVGSTRQTVGSWKNLPLFAAELEVEIEELNAQEQNKYRFGGTKALDVLVSIMESKETKTSDRIRAALALSERSLRIQEFSELKQELKKLKELVEDDKN